MINHKVTSLTPGQKLFLKVTPRSRVQVTFVGHFDEVFPGSCDGPTQACVVSLDEDLFHPTLKKVTHHAGDRVGPYRYELFLTRVGETQVEEVWTGNPSCCG